MTDISSSRAATTRTDGRTKMQKAALIVGATFLLVGVLGFVPGITSDFDDISFGGHESDAKLLGIFEVSVLHNLVHLAFGVAGVLAAKTYKASRSFLLVGGAAYLVLLVYGLLVDHDSDANFVPVNNADNWLHLALGLGMIGLGVALAERHADVPVSSGSSRIR